jgi:hypothetical protein
MEQVEEVMKVTGRKKEEWKELADEFWRNSEQVDTDSEGDEFEWKPLPTSTIGLASKSIQDGYYEDYKNKMGIKDHWEENQKRLANLHDYRPGPGTLKGYY